MQLPEDESLAPRVWMDFAREDIGTALLTLPRRLTRSTCFHAQQAAEKALKAYLAALSDEDIPKTHDLLLLSAVIAERGGAEPPQDGLRELNQHAVMTRYPLSEAPTQTEAADALGFAQRIVRFVEEMLASTAQAVRAQSEDGDTPSETPAFRDDGGEPGASATNATDEPER